MFKLMKYEWKSKRNYVIAGLVILLLLNFRIYIKNMSLNSRILSIVISNLSWYFIGFLVLMISHIQSLYKILFTDEGSFIFLTPLSSYEIIGSKIIAGVIDVFILVNLTIAVFLINFQLTDARVLKQGIELLKLSGIYLNESLPIIVISMFLSYCLLLMTIYLSMILVKTILYNFKYNKTLSFIAFIFVSYLNQLIISNVINNQLEYSKITLLTISGIFIKTSLLIILLFMISGFLLEEKLNS